MVDAMSLNEIAQRNAFTYSGGQKRRLSLGIALIGSSRILLLDGRLNSLLRSMAISDVFSLEPSTGLDPASRRRMWDILNGAGKNSRATVITTHSMEEADALCSRLSILVNGSLQCIGSSQHIKSRFGHTYCLDLSLPPSTSQLPGEADEAIEQIVRRVSEHCGSVQLLNRYGNHIRLSLPVQSLRLPPLLSGIHELLEEGVCVDFVLSQPTLDQIFIRFASQQRE
jgi:ABC-type multidrug transport system ATPase subunit